MVHRPFMHVVVYARANEEKKCPLWLQEDYLTNYTSKLNQDYGEELEAMGLPKEAWQVSVPILLLILWDRTLRSPSCNEPL